MQLVMKHYAFASVCCGAKGWSKLTANISYESIQTAMKRRGPKIKKMFLTTEQPTCVECNVSQMI